MQKEKFVLPLKTLFAGVLFCGLTMQNSAVAQSNAGSPVFVALDVLIAKFESELPALARSTNSTTFSSVSVSSNLGPDVERYLLKRLESAENKSSDFKFVRCTDCFRVRAETDGGSVVVRKGIQDKKELAQIASTLGVNSYTEAQLVYSGSRVILHLNTYSTQNDEVLWSKKLETGLLHVRKSSIRTSITLLQGRSKLENGDDFYPAAAQITVGERIYGYGTFGLELMATSRDTAPANFLLVGPAAYLNLNELLSKPWAWGDVEVFGKAGFALYQKKSDFGFGGGAKLRIGSIFHFKLDYTQGIGFTKNKSSRSEYGYGQRTEETKVKFPGTLFLGFGADLG